MKIDNEFKSLIPPLTDDERGELEKSILADGCRDALVLWGDILIDGQNRYEICERYGIPYKTVQMEFASREDAMLWILQNQLARRNLSDFNKSRIAIKYKDFFTEQAAERKRANGGFRGNRYTGSVSGTPSASMVPVEHQSEALAEVQIFAPPLKQKTRDAIADMAGVSRETIRKVEVIETNAPKPVIHAAENNIISIDKAYHATKAAERSPELKRRLETTKPYDIPEALAEAMDEAYKKAKRQSKIMNFWTTAYTLDYDDTDYDIWFSDMNEDWMANQERIVDGAVENVHKIQKRFHEICKERRRPRLVK